MPYDHLEFLSSHGMEAFHWDVKEEAKEERWWTGPEQHILCAVTAALVLAAKVTAWHSLVTTQFCLFKAQSVFFFLGSGQFLKPSAQSQTRSVESCTWAQGRRRRCTCFPRSGRGALVDPPAQPAAFPVLQHDRLKLRGIRNPFWSFLLSGCHEFIF